MMRGREPEKDAQHRHEPRRTPQALEAAYEDAVEVTDERKEQQGAHGDGDVL